MVRFIVEIVDASGNRQWVFLNGRTTTDIRKQVADADRGFTVNDAMEDTDPRVQDLLTMHEGPTEFTIPTFEDVIKTPEVMKTSGEIVADEAAEKARLAEEARLARLAAEAGTMIDTTNSAEPWLPEDLGGANVAFDRALQSIGYDRGVLGTIGRSKFADLNALAMLGKVAGRDTEMFQDLGQGRNMQDFFTKALSRLSGGRAPGATAAYDLPAEATALFNQEVDPSSDLFNFYNPKLGMGRGQAGVGEDLSGYDAALLSAQLGLAGLGAKRFGGAFSGMLPSAQTLVSGFQSQPVGSPTAQTDIRAYIRDRLSAPKATAAPMPLG